MDPVWIAAVVAALGGGAVMLFRSQRRISRIRVLGLTSRPERAGHYLGTHPDAAAAANVMVGATDTSLCFLALGSGKVVLAIPLADVSAATVVNHATWKGETDRIGLPTAGAADDMTVLDVQNLAQQRALQRRTQWLALVASARGEVALLHPTHEGAEHTRQLVERLLSRDPHDRVQRS